MGRGIGAWVQPFNSILTNVDRYFWVPYLGAFQKCRHFGPELANSIENAIAIAFLSTIAIAIDKAIFQLLLLLLLLIRASSNY